MSAPTPIALFLFMVWRERRGDLEAWSDWNRKLFYAAVVLAVVAIGLAIAIVITTLTIVPTTV